MALEDPCIFTACKEDSHLVRPSSSSGSLHLLGGKATLNMQTLLPQLLRFDILVTWSWSQESSQLRTDSSTDDTNAPSEEKGGHWTILRAVATPVSDSKTNPIHILVTGIVSSVLTAPSRQFYWQYKRSEAARRQPSGSAAGRQRLAWQWEIREEKEAEALSYNYIICHQKTSVVVTIFRWLLLKVTPIKILTIMFWQRLAWRCETWEETDLWRPRGEQFEF